jgi:A/G-specific adenine glycosylase
LSGDLHDFAARVVAWQKHHGRHDLPWQKTSDPYRVWLSEVMLQQTQVATVRTYFTRFVERFPDVWQLAAASQDEVLGLWSGLGYYSRARNLQLCAQQVVTQYHGQFPRRAEELQTLPGIGRSTAAAIASLCFGERVAILDANVKRVVTRVLGFDADLAQAVNERALWEAAGGLLPAQRVARTSMMDYTQGMMDLGALVCLPKKPLCTTCPVLQQCRAAESGEPQRYPVRIRTLKRSSQSLWLLWLRRADGSVWLYKRPPTGVWAGLYCMPVFDSDHELREALPVQLQKRLRMQPAFRHVLTHKDLHLHPCVIDLHQRQRAEWGEGRWFSATQWPALGLPAPIRTLLEAPGGA